MRVFVAGATGVVGRRLVPLLVSEGHQVTAVGRSPEKRAALARAGATPVQVDLFDRWAVGRALEGHEAVINVTTHIPPSSGRMMLPGAWKENDRIRRDASANLAAAARAAGAGRFVQESFAPIYADGGEQWIDESWPVRPVRYNRTVLDAERAAAEFTGSGGIGVVLRFAAFYGDDAFHVRDAIRMIRKGWAPLPGPATAFFSSIHHDDAAAAAAAALRASAGVYNVSDDEPLRRRDYVDSLAGALGVPPPKLPPLWLTRLGGSLAELMSRSLRISNRKFRQETGWAPRFPSVRDGWPAVVRLLQAA
ncbi:MAG TPA: NAD(P)-dependent oxidoreductase [Gemmatimonadales bacterium]|nr:NAD(P)-dependent oxidoreductase [Gemmatimonadales bacterium]